MIQTIPLRSSPAARAAIMHAGILIIMMLALASVLGLVSVWARVFYELQGPYTFDTPIYWAVGRGILNGLIPYQDLFETKPPGIFVLSSLSLWLGGNMHIGAIMQACVFALLPIAVVIGGMNTCHRRHRGLEMGIFLAALSFGCLLSLYSADRSGEFQVESFGALFITLYAAFIVKNHSQWKALHYGIASALIYCGVGLKEPFILSAFACSLLLAERPRDILRTFVLPSIIAGFAGIATLTAIGWLHPYLTIYLPEMLGKHIQAGEPLWKRGLFFEGTFNDVKGYVPAFGFLTAGLLGCTFLRFHGKKVFSTVTFTLFSTSLAIYLLILAIGTGGSFWNHHYVFAVPGYAALFFLFTQSLRAHWQYASPRIALTAFSLVALIASTYLPVPDYAGMIGNIQNDEKITQESARYIDAVLDACGIERYLFLGGNGSHPFGFTKHSPIGPLFLQYDEWLQNDRSEFRRAMLSQINTASFVVKDTVNISLMTMNIDTYLERYFTKVPWPCAEHILQDHRYQYLFRFATPVTPLME